MKKELNRGLLFGEEQNKLDVLSNEVFVKALTSSGRTNILISEENEESIVVPTQLRGRFWLFGPSALEHQPILFSFQRRKTGRSLRNRSVSLLCPCVVAALLSLPAIWTCAFAPFVAMYLRCVTWDFSEPLLLPIGLHQVEEQSSLYPGNLLDNRWSR